MSKRREVRRFPRARDGQPSHGPDGNYHSGISDAAIAMALGHVVSYWPQIEERMMLVMRNLIGASNEIPVRQIFRTIVSQDARIKVMKSLLENSRINNTKGAVYDYMIDEFASLNKARNKYVHGLWWTHQSGRTFIQEASADEFSLFDRREVRVREMDEVIERMSKLWWRMTGILVFAAAEEPASFPPRPSNETSQPEANE